MHALVATPARSEINVAPLVDVVLVLLIIFMVMTPLADPSLRALLPEDSDGATIPSRVLTLRVDAAGRFHFGEQAVADAELATRLAAELKQHPLEAIVVSAEGRAAYPRFIALVDAAYAAGANKVAIEP